MADDKIKYNVGVRVQVSMDKEKYGEIWCAGTVLKVIGKKFVLVKYDEEKVTECNFVKSSEEIVDLEYVTQDRISGRKRKSLDAKTSDAHISAPTSSDSKNVTFSSKDKNTPDVSVLENSKKPNGCKPTKYSTCDVETLNQPELVVNNSKHHKTSNEVETCTNGMKNQTLKGDPKMLVVATTPNQTTNNSDLNQTVRPQEDVAIVERITIDLNGTPSIEDWPPIDPSLTGSSLLGEVNVNHEPTQNNNDDQVVTVPFTKLSTMWKDVDAMEVFKIFPQKPHFHALKQHELEFRDGMAIGLMITFANMVNSIKILRITDAKYVFEEKLKFLLPLELNGFNIEPLRFRLEKLLEVQSSVNQSKEKKQRIEGLLAGKDKEKDQLDKLIENNDKTIMELEENLSRSLKERGLLAMKIKQKDSERAQLKMDLRAIEEALVSAEKDFNASSDAPW